MLRTNTSSKATPAEPIIPAPALAVVPTPSDAPLPAAAVMALATAVGAEQSWSIDRLKANVRNARKHPKKQIEQLRASIRQYGQVWPLLVRSDGTLVSGHGRLEALKHEGFAEVRVLVVDWNDT